MLCSQREVVEKDRILERKDEQITEKDALLAQKYEEVADKDTQLARQQQVSNFITSLLQAISYYANHAS